MTPDEQIKRVEDFMTYINKGDWVGVSEFIHDDFVVVGQPGVPSEGTWRGAEGLARLGDVLKATWSSWRDSPYPYELASVGNRVFKEVRFKARAAKTGKEIEMDFVEVFEFRGDKIAVVRPYYWDPSAIKLALQEK